MDKVEQIKNLTSINKALLSLSGHLLVAYDEIMRAILKIEDGTITASKDVRLIVKKVRQSIESRVDWLRPIENKFFAAEKE